MRSDGGGSKTGAASATSAYFDEPFLGEGVEELEDEEGVAGRALESAPQHRAGVGGQFRCRQLADRLVPERTEGEMSPSGLEDAVQEPGQLRRPGQWPAGQDGENGEVGQPPTEHVQRLEGAGVAPVDVVEYGQEGSADGGALDQVDDAFGHSVAAVGRLPGRLGAEVEQVGDGRPVGVGRAGVDGQGISQQPERAGLELLGPGPVQ